MRIDIHDFCIAQGLSIARSDGELPLLVDGFYEDLLKNMQEGSAFADFGASRAVAKASFRTHYLRPRSHRGYLPGIRSAGETCERFYALAQYNWWHGAHSKAAFYLGAASHLVQDLCCPFHTTHRELRAHTEFERKLERMDRFVIGSQGIYEFPELVGHHRDDTAFGWVDFNAHRSAGKLRRLLRTDRPWKDDEQVGWIIGEAQRTTAGFIAMFFRSVEVAAGSHTFPGAVLLDPYQETEALAAVR